MTDTKAPPFDPEQWRRRLRPPDRALNHPRGRS
jgi:hypothetical protein